MTIKNTSEYEKSSVEEAVRLLETSLDGLTEFEAKKRIEKIGYNEVVEKERNPILDFLSRYWGPMPWLLELTIALSYFLHHYLEVCDNFWLAYNECCHRLSTYTQFAESVRSPKEKTSG